MMWYLDSGGSHPGVHKGCEDFPVNEHPNSVANLLWREIISSEVPPLLSEILPNRSITHRTSGMVHPSTAGICAQCWGGCWGSLSPFIFLFWSEHHLSLWILWLCSSAAVGFHQLWEHKSVDEHLLICPTGTWVGPKALTQRVKSPPLLWLWTGEPWADFSEFLPTRIVLQRDPDPADSESTLPGCSVIHYPIEKKPTHYFEFKFACL